jgi:hypothetical protein
VGPHDSANDVPPDRFDGWKEIAGFLRVSERTAQRYEQIRNLPVHRIAPSDSDARHTRSDRVYAFRSELRLWMETDGKAALSEEDQGVSDAAPRGAAVKADGEVGLCEASRAPSEATTAAFNEARRLFGLVHSPARLGKPVLITCSALVVIAASLFIGSAYLGSDSTPSGPAAVELDRERGVLTAVDADGNALWTYRPGIRADHTLASAREMVNLDDDAAKEVIATVAESPPHGRFRDEVIAFDHDGTVLWRYRPGRLVQWKASDHWSEFGIKSFSVGGRLPDGRTLVVVVANHIPDYPSQVSILDTSGKLLGEYWNTGYILTHDLVDYDQDGVEEIIVGGINDFLDRPCLAVIRHDIRMGISPIPPGFAPGFNAGRELVYAVFARSRLSDALNLDSRVRLVRVLDGPSFHIELELGDQSDTQERVYQMDRSLQVTRMILPRSFLALHTKSRRQGLMETDLDETERRRLRQLDIIVPGTGVWPPRLASSNPEDGPARGAK